MALNLKSYGIFTPLRLQIKQVHNRCRIGNRDWVGFGINGSANYKDDAAFPFPAVRFKENTRDICVMYQALREKEKGDWRMLCCEEKKALYRASFCQTFAEFQHPTGHWKAILGIVIGMTSFTMWVFMFNHYYVFEPLPASLSRTAQKAQLRRMLEIRTNPIDGLASKWDYDNDRWKGRFEFVVGPEIRYHLDWEFQSLDRLTTAYSAEYSPRGLIHQSWFIQGVAARFVITILVLINEDTKPCSVSFNHGVKWPQMFHRFYCCLKLFYQYSGKRIQDSECPSKSVQSKLRMKSLL